jgi:hypothetical protein
MEDDDLVTEIPDLLSDIQVTKTWDLGCMDPKSKR